MIYKIKENQIYATKLQYLKLRLILTLILNTQYRYLILDYLILDPLLNLYSISFVHFFCMTHRIFKKDII